MTDAAERVQDLEDETVLRIYGRFTVDVEVLSRQAGRGWTRWPISVKDTGQHLGAILQREGEDGLRVLVNRPGTGYKLLDGVRVDSWAEAVQAMLEDRLRRSLW